MQNQHFLTNIFQEEDFTPQELEIIFAKFTQVELSKNAFFLKEGKVENHYWFIQTGFARSFVLDTEGRDITTHFYAKGDIVIDWPSIFLRNPTRENIQAITDCVCWQIDFDSFQALFHGYKNFREHGRTILVASYFDLKKHSVSIMADQAKERYLQLVRDKPELLQNISLKHIATYLGITDTSLSRIRKEIAG